MSAEITSERPKSCPACGSENVNLAFTVGVIYWMICFDCGRRGSVKSIEEAGEEGKTNGH